MALHKDDMHKKSCDCFEPLHSNKKWNSELKVHADTQDRQSCAWLDLVDLIETAAIDRREEFAPAKELGKDAWSSISTLPRQIAKLKDVRHLLLYGSNLTWLPPEIGQMHSLEEFTPYTSHMLHWFPYEITRCKNLRSSTVSTRALYGNYKHRPPFPHLKKNPVPNYGDQAKCSVCDSSLHVGRVNQVWISLRVAMDVLPLLVNLCSEECRQKIPSPTEGYVQKLHKGGLGLSQPKLKR